MHQKVQQRKREAQPRTSSLVPYDWLCDAWSQQQGKPGGSVTFFKKKFNIDRYRLHLVSVTHTLIAVQMHIAKKIIKKLRKEKNILPLIHIT
jgi:hypothetical protein